MSSSNSLGGGGGSGAGASAPAQTTSSGNSLRDRLLSTAAASLAAHALGSTAGPAQSAAASMATTAVFDPAFSVDGTEELSAGAPLGTFVHLPHACKLFETLKGAYKVPR